MSSRMTSIEVNLTGIVLVYHFLICCLQICQKADGSFYNCGQITKPIWLMDDWPAPDSGEDWPNWQVEFTFGSTWRISIFKFIVDHKVEKPVVKFISEDPVVQYVSDINVSAVIYFVYRNQFCVAEF